MSVGAIRSLEEAAQARVDAVAEVEAAEAALEALMPEYDAARQRVAEAKKRVKLLDQGMGAAKKAHAVGRALRDQAIATEDPPLVVLPPSFSTELPQVYLLSAVAGDGTGLYELVRQRTYHRRPKSYAIRFERAPEGTEAEKWERMRDAGLLLWHERGSGDFGPGSGSIKPKRPPDGGRWRWLKIREQEELAEATG